MEDKFETFFFCGGNDNLGKEIPDAVLLGDGEGTAGLSDSVELLCKKYATLEQHAARALCLASEALMLGGESVLEPTALTAALSATAAFCPGVSERSGTLAEKLVEASRAAISRGVLTAPTAFTESPEGPVPLGKRVVVECPARIDLCGGWSDTPPLTYDAGGAVCNAAITLNGKYPIGVCARRIPEHVIRLRQRSGNGDL